MKLPNRGRAFVAVEKITSYLLNMQHPKGRGKAIFFTQYGFSVAKWQQLADALFAHAQNHEIARTEQTRFGTRYLIEGELATPVGRRPQVRVVWFIREGETAPRFVTAYPLEEEND